MGGARGFRAGDNDSGFARGVHYAPKAVYDSAVDAVRQFLLNAGIKP